MVDYNYLPRNYLRSFRRAANASDAVRNMMLSFHPAYATVFDNFLGDAIAGTYETAKTNGTSAAATVSASRLVLTTGTDDNGYAGLGPWVGWKGDNGIYFESTQLLSAITTVKMEIGLSDSAQDAGAVATKATPTATADDFTVLVLDTDDNTEWDIISTLDAGTCTANHENVFAAVAGVPFRTEFVMQNDKVAVFVNGTNKGSGNCQGGDLMTPWVFTQARAGTASRDGSVEYIFCTGPNGLVVP